MWRFVSGCVREGFHREARCVKETVTPNTPTVTSIKRDSGRRREDHKHQDWCRLHLCDNWIDAFTWSGALLLGWYASKFALLWQKTLSPDAECKLFKRGYLQGYQSLLCSRIVFAQPPTLTQQLDSLTLDDLARPQIGIKALPTVVNVSNDAPSSEGDTSGDREFRDVLRSIENKLGIAAIEEGKVQEGLAMLKSSAQKNYVPAIFNLAVCYEKGMGVVQDEKTAVELYKIAASKSHPGALYNLAVFYGQGRGGLTRDPEAAHDLLRIAAAKGQKEAIAAIETLKMREKQTSLTHENAPTEMHMSPTAAFLHLLNQEEKPMHKKSILLF